MPTLQNQTASQPSPAGGDNSIDIRESKGAIRWNGTKRLIVANANTGAKFTPENHRPIGNKILDSILQGVHIPIGMEAILAEIEGMYRSGVRYIHWHARNPTTREQSCDNGLYQEFGMRVRGRFPGIAISYGASRNGREIIEAVALKGEWERMSQAALLRSEGGADFVTIQAAAELMIVVDLERQGYVRFDETNSSMVIRKPLETYVASKPMEVISIEANSTHGGANYGSNSASEQLRSFGRAITIRNVNNLPQEVEWTQLPRSYMMTKFALDYLRPSLGETGRLNITLLFGFSPKLPFPLTYEEFRKVVKLARSLEQRSVFPELHLSISVGAALLPQKADELVCPLDVGPHQGCPSDAAGATGRVCLSARQ